MQCGSFRCEVKRTIAIRGVEWYYYYCPLKRTICSVSDWICWMSVFVRGAHIMNRSSWVGCRQMNSFSHKIEIASVLCQKS